MHENRQTIYFLKTERLGFRPWTENDFDLALELWGNLEVTKLIGGPFSEKQIRDRLNQEIVCMSACGVQYWPIFTIADNAHVGCCGLRPYKPDERIYEIGVHLKPEYQGMGLAQEAVLAVMDYAFNSLSAAGLFAGHNPSNEASRRLLKKLRFRYTHDEFYPPTGLNHPSYTILAGEMSQLPGEK
ncbi:MAG: GNAT family N-acetyltransferase [candidate division Zixibacteria bacterium HGW-Zixibacteria-1]|nr:MAG: GNAT family N-acetyltransferase [candidate division Zixibacteria bacterium HGW-Zixibacteria-1]